MTTVSVISALQRCRIGGPATVPGRSPHHLAFCYGISVRNADQILVVANGEIVGRGLQEELLQNCPLYRKMWQDYAGSIEGGAEDV